MCLASSSADQLLLPPSQIPSHLHELCHFGLGCLHILPQTQSEFALPKLNFSSSVCELLCSYLLITSEFSLRCRNVMLIEAGVCYRTKTRPLQLLHHPEHEHLVILFIFIFKSPPALKLLRPLFFKFPNCLPFVNLCITRGNLHFWFHISSDIFAGAQGSGPST